ncbi:MAG: NfeD family protein [Gemmatimonadota bacterium]
MAEALAQWAWVAGLFAAGLVLVALDLFVTPGIDVLGALGVLCILGAVGYAYGALGPQAALIAAGVGLATLGGLGWLVARHPPWRRLVLDGRPAKEPPTAAGPDAIAPERTGTALSALRPSGRARFGERTVDVVTEGAFLDAGTEVTVVRVEGHRVVVTASES